MNQITNAHVHRLNNDPAYRLNSENKVPNRFIHQRGNDAPAGIYLHLWHGRCNPEQDMDDWGEDCRELFGPINHVGHTYNSTTQVAFGDDYQHEVWLSEAIQKEVLHELHHNVLASFDDMLYFDGMYYGDWTFFHHKGGTL